MALKILETYSSLDRYSDSSATTIELTMYGQTSTISLESEFAFERPQKARLVVTHGTFGSSVWCDGTKLRSLLPLSKEYKSTDAPARFDNIYIHLPVWDHQSVLPCAPRLMTQQDPADFLLRDVEDKKLVGQEKEGGVLTYHLQLTYSNGDTRDLWARTSDLLIVKEQTVSTRNDALGLTPETPAGAVPVTITHTHKNIDLPNSFPSTTWTVALPEGAEEVDRFSLEED